jgi:predicted kinase
MKTFYMLVGLPGSGKSTWAKNTYPSAIIGSSDAFIEDHAKNIGKTYNEVFVEMVKKAQESCNQIVQKAFVNNEETVIWDQTNLSIKSRKNRLAFVPKDYKKVAIVVSCSDEKQWKERLDSRPGKTIPFGILETMKRSFQTPTVEEGFDEIVIIDTALQMA